jgi:hypothetical protein
VRRLCEFLGCEFLGEHDMPNRRMALYALERAPSRDPGRAAPLVSAGYGVAHSLRRAAVSSICRLHNNFRGRRIGRASNHFGASRRKGLK